MLLVYTPPKRTKVVLKTIPLPSSQNIMPAGNDAVFWDSQAQSYSKRPVKDNDAYQKTLDRTFAFLKDTDSVLELGCGTGSTALRLAPATRSYLGTDISAEMIQIANSKAGSENSTLTFRVATAETLAAGETRFNAVLAFNYLHLVRDLPSTLRNIHGLLEDGGLFISKTGCVGEMNVMLRMAIPVARLVGKAPFVNMFGEPELLQSITDAGFEIVEKEIHASSHNDHRPFIVARKM